MQLLSCRDLSFLLIVNLTSSSVVSAQVEKMCCGIMNRLREQVASILSTQTEQGFRPWGKIPEKANTTSTTKIIDGHVVTINETTYSDGDDRFGSTFLVRVIDVKPQNETLQIGGNPDAESINSSDSKKAVENTTPSRSVESVEDFDNEITKNREDTLTA